MFRNTILFFSSVCRYFFRGFFFLLISTELSTLKCLPTQFQIDPLNLFYSIPSLELGSHRPKSIKILIRENYLVVTEDKRRTDQEAMRLVQRKMKKKTRTSGS